MPPGFRDEKPAVARRAQVRLGKQGLRRAAAARNWRRRDRCARLPPLAPRFIRSRFQSAAVTAAAPLATTSRSGSRKSAAVGQVRPRPPAALIVRPSCAARGDQHAAPVEADRKHCLRRPAARQVIAASKARRSEIARCIPYRARAARSPFRCEQTSSALRSVRLSTSGSASTTRRGVKQRVRLQRAVHHGHAQPVSRRSRGTSA